MHELGVTMEIVDAVVERAAGRTVRTVRVEVGALTTLVPSALELCFEVCAVEAGIAGAALVVDTVAGRARCRTCRVEFGLDLPYGACNGCGGVDLEWLAGYELRIVSLEVG